MMALGISTNVHVLVNLESVMNVPKNTIAKRLKFKDREEVAHSPIQPDLECFQGWGLHYPLGNLFQCLTTLIVKNFFLKSSLNLPSLSLKPLLLVLSQQALLKILEGCYKVSPQPSLLQAEQPKLSQPILVGEVLQPSDHFCGPPLDPLQQLHVLLVLRAPELDAVLEGCSRSHHPVLKSRIAATQVQDPALGLVEPHEVHTGPLLRLVQVPLDDIVSFWCVSCTTQLGVICQLAEGALDLDVNVIDENIEQHWSQYGPLRDTTSIDRYPLDATIQPIPYPLNSLPIKSVSLQFKEKDVFDQHVLTQLCRSLPFLARFPTSGDWELLRFVESIRKGLPALFCSPGPDYTPRLSHIPQDCELHQCVTTAAQAASNLDVTDELTCIGDHQVQYCIPLASRLGAGKKLGGETAGTADPNGLKGCPILYDLVLTIKAGGKEEEEGKFVVMAFVFPSLLLLGVACATTVDLDVSLDPQGESMQQFGTPDGTHSAWLQDPLRTGISRRDSSSQSDHCGSRQGPSKGKKEHFDNSNGDAPGLADGQSIAAVSVLL
ncbi:hypothetical protein QYF61_010444 [Mycteria americana]|uniref:Uncharacterized protein n=1 Tax=Mycteria americana TaxID=33587 RepID=A0AAN7NI07_MYCAM|nr:hypothetical protein QYF61_010444 [Mycteria americana]